MQGLDVAGHELNRRFRARRAAQIVSREILSSLVAQYSQSTNPKSGELNCDFAIPRGRGAPFGNRNRLAHGRHTSEIKQLRADVRAQLREACALLGKTRLS